MIAAGLNDDPRPMISRLNDLLTKALEKHWQLLHHELWGLMLLKSHGAFRLKLTASGVHLSSSWRVIETWKLRMHFFVLLVFIRYSSQILQTSASAHTPSEGFKHAKTSFFKEHLMCFRVKRHLSCLYFLQKCKMSTLVQPAEDENWQLFRSIDVLPS